MATNLEPLLTLDEAARLLNTSRSWVENQIRAGRLRKTKLGKIVRIEPADLRAFIDQHKPPAVEETVTTLRLQDEVTPGTKTLQVTHENKR